MMILRGVLTVSHFYHFNSANYDSSPNDFPNAITDDRTSNYVGAQTTLSFTVARNSIEGGFYGFWQHDNQFFGVLFNHGFNLPVSDREFVPGNMQALCVQDRFAVQ